MRTPWILLLLAFIVTACAPADDVLPPSPPRALDVTNVGGQAWLSPRDFDNSESLQARWAPPWDVWADDQYIMYTPYSTVMGRPAYLEFFLWGDRWERNVGGQVPLVYGQAYVLNAQTKKWSPINLNGKYSSKYNGFIELEKTTYNYDYTYYDENGDEQTSTYYQAYFSAPSTVITPDKLSEGDNYVATYICSAMVPVDYRNYKFTYACGCLKDDLNSCGRWNIQRLTINPAPTCGNNRCEQGETPWTCTQDCLDGPGAPVALTEEEAEGTDFCMLWNAGEEVECALRVIDSRAGLAIWNGGNENLRFSELVVRQLEDQVDCPMGSIELEPSQELERWTACTPPITSIGTADFYIEGFVSYGSGGGNEVWGYARTKLSNYRADAPTDTDAILINFIEIASREVILQAWMGEGERTTFTLLDQLYEVEITAIDVYGRALLSVNGVHDVQPIGENQRIHFDDRIVAEIKDIIVRENAPQPPNSVQIALYNDETLLSDYLSVGEFKEYTINGDTYTVQPVQVAGKRASLKITGPEFAAARLLQEGYSTNIGDSREYGTALRLESVMYQGTPDECTGEIATCSGSIAINYACVEHDESGFENFAWPFYVGDEYVCSGGCSEGQCQQTSSLNVCAELHRNEGFRFGEGQDFRFYDINAGEQTIVLRNWNTHVEIEATYTTAGSTHTGDVTIGGVSYPFNLYGPDTIDTTACFSNVVKLIQNSGQNIQISEGETVILKEYTEGYVSGETEVTALFISGTHAKFLVNGETTASIAEGDWDAVAGKRLKVTKHNGEGMPVSFIVHNPITDFEAVACGYEGDTFAFHNNHTGTFNGANKELEQASFGISSGGTAHTSYTDWGSESHGTLIVGGGSYSGDSQEYRFRLDQGNTRICFEEGVEIQTPPAPETPE